MHVDIKWFCEGSERESSRLLWHARNLLGEYWPACLSTQSSECLDRTLPFIPYLSEKIWQRGEGKKRHKGGWQGKQERSVWSHSRETFGGGASEEGVVPCPVQH